MKKIATAISLITLIFGGSCRDNECKLCILPHSNPSFVILLKSDSIPDLLNPRTGIYDPSKVMIYEDINRNGKVVRTLANYSYDSSYQLGYVYRLIYNCSLSSQNNVQRSLIQLKAGIVDTLTYESAPSYYPVNAYYNGKLVWWHGSLH